MLRPSPVVSSGVPTSRTCDYEVPPTAMSKRCQQAAADAAEEREIPTRRVHSGAGHDTMQVATVTDAGLLFVASENGHSHSPKELARWDDCTAATTVLADTVLPLATDTHDTR